MIISFDIDDTLILYDKTKNGSDSARLLSGEILRDGAVDLLKRLQRDHELWIYTTSLRSPFLLKLSFRLHGICIKNVINQVKHQKHCERLKLKTFPTKYPSKFGINLHIDDSPGVVEEGKRYGFNVIRICPDDKNWASTLESSISTYP